MDSRASKAGTSDTPSRVMTRSDTAGEVKLMAPQEGVEVAVELVELEEVVVELVAAEVEARRR